MRELTLNEVEVVSGGDVDWGVVGTGAGLIGLGIAIAATGGLAGLGVGLIVGAGTFGEMAVAGAAVASAGLGGFAIGEAVQ